MSAEITVSAAAGSRTIIRSANWRDLNAVRGLEQRCFPKDAWPLWDIIGVLTMPNIVRLKATSNDALVGFIAGEVHDGDHGVVARVAWISTVAVLPEYRGQGIGTALMKACEERLSTATVRLSVRRSNTGAIRLYEALGYHPVETWMRYYQDGEDALVLEKPLRPPAAGMGRL